MNTPERVQPSASGLPVGAASKLDLAAAPSDSIDIVGSDIGKYHVVRKLGEGGMGAVFEAVHSEIGQRAAIKVLHAHLTQQPKFIRRFVDEARLISMVGHPGLVKVYDFTKTSTGAQCIVMEFLVGESLWSRCNRVKGKAAAQAAPGASVLPMTEALQITRQVASALSAVHARGIIHRDLKPENIMLVADPDTQTGERAKILDFGIARLEEPDAGERQTTSGVSLGTPTYMAPEQIEGLQNPTDRLDVYALGIILYELLSGEPPFQSSTTGGILRQHLIKEPPPLPAHVPAEVQALVVAALQKEPTARPTMAQLVERIDALGSASRLSGAAAPVVPVSPGVPQTAAPRPRRAIYIGSAAVLAVAVLALLVFLLRKPPTEAVQMPPQAKTPVRAGTAPPAADETPISPVKDTPPPIDKPAPPQQARPESPPTKKPTPKGEGKSRPGKGLRFGDLPRTSRK